MSIFFCNFARKSRRKYTMALQLDLYCPICMAELVRKGIKDGIESLEPLFSDTYEVINDGIYHTHCSKGHEGIVILQNLQFELLYELAVNAIADCYYREAVASATAAMERYFEFFIKVANEIQGIDIQAFNKNWKNVSNMSERQLGAYIFLYSIVLKKEAQLLSNSQTAFRNSVIHKGEFPTREKTIEYVNAIYNLILDSLKQLIDSYPEQVKNTYEVNLPKYNRAEDEDTLSINHPTLISVIELASSKDSFKERGSVEEQVTFVTNRRGRQRLRFAHDVNDLISEDETIAAKNALLQNNENITSNEYQFQIETDLSIDGCIDLLENDFNEYEGLLGWLHEKAPEHFRNDMLTVGWANLQTHSEIYMQYLRARVYKLMSESNPTDEVLKNKYIEAERKLEQFHHNLSVAD